MKFYPIKKLSVRWTLHLVITLSLYQLYNPASLKIHQASIFVKKIASRFL